MFSRTDIPIRPSNWVGFIAALPWCALTAFTLVLAVVYGAGFLVLLTPAAAGAVYQWHLNGQLSLHRSVTRLIITESGLVAERAHGDQFPVAVDSESRLYSQLAILKLNPTDTTHKSCTVILWASGRNIGNVPGDLHRQLRAWLRLGART